MRVPSRKRSQNPPKGKRNIIDSKVPDGKGYVSVPLSRVHTLKLTPSSPENNGSLAEVTRLYQTFLGGPLAYRFRGLFKNLRMLTEGFFFGPMWPPITWVFWGVKNRAAQGPLRWNLHRPKLPPLPGEKGRWLEKNGIFPKMGGNNIRHETDLKRMEILWTWISKKKRHPY